MLLVRVKWKDVLGNVWVDIVPDKLYERLVHRICINGGSIVEERKEMVE